MKEDKPKITSKMLDDILEQFANEKYPKSRREGIRKFSLDTREAVNNSKECLWTTATILAKMPNNVDAAVYTALASGIVIGYLLKESQIEKIIDDVTSN